MKKESYTKKQYPMLCPKCNNIFIIQKHDVYTSTDRALGTFYYAKCPNCQNEVDEAQFGFLVRKYNPGWISNHKMIIYTDAGVANR